MKKTVFKVTRRRVEEESFYVTSDCEGIDEEHVITQGPKETEQLQTFLQKANTSNDVQRSIPRTSWILTPLDNDDTINRVIVGELEFVKRFYAKVEFKVTHSITRLIEVKAPSRKEAANILSDRLDDDVSDILEKVSEELYTDENIENSDTEVVGWGTNPDDLTTHYRHPVKSYSTED